jgi:hypothetical protein
MRKPARKIADGFRRLSAENGENRPPDVLKLFGSIIAGYFSDVLMLVNFVLRVEPRPIMARLMPAAIKQSSSQHLLYASNPLLGFSAQCG